MAETITITIPDGYENEVLDCMAESFGFVGTYEEKKAFLQDNVKQYINNIVSSIIKDRTIREAERKLETAKAKLKSAQEDPNPDIL